MTTGLSKLMFDENGIEIPQDEPSNQLETSLLEEYSKAIAVTRPGVPIQIALLDRLPANMTRQQKYAVYSSYCQNTNRKAIGGNFIDRVARIMGATIEWHPPYMGKPDSDGVSRAKPGYYHILMRTDQVTEKEVIVNGKVLKVRQPLIIECSSQKIAEFVLSQMDLWGPYDWEEPQYVLFTGAQSEGYSARVLSAEELSQVFDDNGRKAK